MPKRKGQVRFGYRKLSKTYRARLERNGVDQAAWEMGADLKVARGHRYTTPLGSQLERTRQKVVRGDAMPDDIAALERVPRPSWLPPGNYLPEVIATMGQLPPPSNWKSITFDARSDGEPWTMTVERKRGRPVTLEIPGGGGEGSGAREILEIVKEVAQQIQPSYTDDDIEEVFRTVRGS